jgi:branched-chain amino acid aminotransferase
MKAYKSLADDSIRLFRPEKNMERLCSSMDRLHMPGGDFDHQELINCISALVLLDKDWIPYGEGYSLYIRPTVIATHKFLGLAAPDSLLLYVITCPVGPYYKSGFDPIRLTADTDYVRAWPGGTGNAKVGGNYAATMKAAADAEKEGYSQILWLFGDNDEATEVGSMNVFFYLINKETNRPELVTAPLTRGDILPGVTRASILDLARSWGDFDVSERFLPMAEIVEAAEENRLLEVFGAGTAAVVSPVSCIQYKGKDIDIPAVGGLTKRVWDEITGIQYGKIEGPPGWGVKVKDDVVG